VTDRILNTYHSSNGSIVVVEFVAAETYLPSTCLTTTVTSGYTVGYRFIHLTYLGVSIYFLMQYRENIVAWKVLYLENGETAAGVDKTKNNLGSSPFFSGARVVTSTWWEGLVLPMILRAMPAGA
jgi:hypothetical protein